MTGRKGPGPPCQSTELHGDHICGDVGPGRATDIRFSPVTVRNQTGNYASDLTLRDPR